MSAVSSSSPALPKMQPSSTYYNLFSENVLQIVVGLVVLSILSIVAYVYRNIFTSNSEVAQDQREVTKFTYKDQTHLIVEEYGFEEKKEEILALMQEWRDCAERTRALIYKKIYDANGYPQDRAIIESSSVFNPIKPPKEGLPYFFYLKDKKIFIPVGRNILKPVSIDGSEVFQQNLFILGRIERKIKKEKKREGHYKFLLCRSAKRVEAVAFIKDGYLKEVCTHYKNIRHEINEDQTRGAGTAVIVHLAKKVLLGLWFSIRLTSVPEAICFYRSFGFIKWVGEGELIFTKEVILEKMQDATSPFAQLSE